MTGYARQPFVEPRMLALVLKPPWTWAFCRAGKLVENRRWEPGRLLKKGDPLAIHAGLSIDKELWTGYEAGSGLKEEPGDGWLLWPPGAPEPPPPSAFVRLLDPRGYRIAPDPPDPALALGAVVAVAIFERVVGQLPEVSSQAKWRTSDGYGWLFSRCDPLPAPVPCRGKQKLWRLREKDSGRVTELWYRGLM